MALRIKWSNKARESFDAIVDYLLINWSESVARNFVRITFNALDSISEFPLIGKLQHKERNIRGLRLVKQIILFYEVKKEEIIILDLFDVRQNPENLRL